MTKDTFPMNIGGGKVRSERMLLAKVENGKNMMSADSVRFLVLHCSASRCNQDYSVEQLRRDHKARGFYDIGYHFYIRTTGCPNSHASPSLAGSSPVSIFMVVDLPQPFEPRNPKISPRGMRKLT